MRKHGYSEADVGAAQMRLVSHRIATTEFVKCCRAHRESLKHDAIVIDIGCVERLLGYQSAEVAESCASNLEMRRANERLDASLILQALCMLPAGQSRGARVPIA